MLKLLLGICLLGVCVRHVYGNKTILANDNAENYFSGAAVNPEDKFPSGSTHESGNEPQYDGGKPPIVAPGIRMTKNESDYRNKPNLEVVPRAAHISTHTSTRRPSRPSPSEDNSRPSPDNSRPSPSEDNSRPSPDNSRPLPSEDNSRPSPDNSRPSPDNSKPPIIHEAAIQDDREGTGSSDKGETHKEVIYSERGNNTEGLHQDTGTQSQDGTDKNNDSTYTSMETNRSSHDDKDAPDDHQHTPPSDPEVVDPRTPRTIDLCSSCLCDPPKRNVVCKHDHLNDGTSHHFVLKKGLIPQNSTSLHILGFETLIIHKGTFSSESLALRQIHFENIGTIRLSKESLFFNSKAKENMETVVLFTRCNIKEIPTEAVTQYSRSEDQRNDIDLEETRFLTIQFRRCNITTIRSYAFYQARLLYFTMSHTKVEHMEENCIYLDIYEEWVVEYSHLPKLEQQTISLRAQMIVVFSRNIIDGLENRSLNINSSNQVLFEYNSVSHLGSEALMGIKPSGYARGANIVFLNNSIAKADNGSLATSRNYPAHERKVLDNKFGILCDCNIKLNFSHLLGITTESDYYDQSTYQTVIEKSLCQRFAEVETYKYIESYYNEECTPLPLPIIISVSIVLALIIITIIVCVVCTQRAARAKEEANYLGECCYSHSFSTLHSNPGPLVPLQSHQCQSWEQGNNIQSWVMAVPEVKTYQETEVEMHYEHTEPMNVSLRGSNPEPLIDFHRKTQVRASCPFN